MSDDLVYWKNALLGILGPIHENDPQCGWYRTRPKRGYASFPVRIWRDRKDAPLRALKAGKTTDPFDIWTWCCMNPVSEDAYNAALESGAPWPDDVPSSYRPSKAIPPLAKASAIRLRHSEAKSTYGEAKSADSKSKHQNDNGHDKRKASNTTPSLPSVNSNTHSSPRSHSSAPSHAHSPFASPSPSIGHNSKKAGDEEHEILRTDPSKDVSLHCKNAAQSKSSLEIILDPLADAREMADHIALLWDDISSWLDENGSIIDQVQADRCANYASALANLEILSEDMRVREKKPFLEACRSVDAKWKPVIEAAKNARTSCKNAIEPFLVSEWFRLEAISGKEGSLFQPPRAGSFGRAIALRFSEKVTITHIEKISNHYSHDARLLKNEAYLKILRQYAEDDLKNGKIVPGAKITEERSVS